MNRSTFSQAIFVAGWLLGIVAATMSLPRAATAQITVTAPNTSLPESSSDQTGTFDIVVAASGSNLPQVGDFTVNLQLSPAGGVDFTGGAATTADPYIFAGQTAGPTVMLADNNTTIQGTDFAATPPTLVNGDGLLAVNYFVPANTSGTFNLTLVTTEPTPTTLDDQNVNPIPITVQNATLTIVPSTVYWNGGIDTNWNTLSGANFATNWSTSADGSTDAHALPGTNTDVFFTTSSGGANLNTMLSAPMSIKGLTFTSAAIHPVSIGGSALTIGADGLTLQSGAAGTTINSAVNLSSSQSWTVSGANPLTVNGTLSLTGQTLTKAGNGTIRLEAAPSLSGGSSLVVNAGTLQLDVTGGNGAVIGSNVTVTVAPSGTLQLAGTVSALSDTSVINPTDGDLVSVTNNGSTASSGGLIVTGTNQSVGTVSGQATTSGGVTTYGGDTTVGDGTTGASLTVTQLLQNTLTINAGSTVTIRPSGGGSPNVVGNASGGSSNSTAVSLAPPVPTSSPTVAASAPTAATPVASVSNPFLGVQAAIGSGSNGAAASAATAATVAPVQTAIASVAADTISSNLVLSNAVASNAVVAGAGADASSSLLALGQTNAADDSSLLGSDDNALLGSQSAGGLAFAASPSAGLAFGAASPMIGGTGVVPEPSSCVLLLIGCTISVVFVVRRRAAGAAVGQ